MFKRLLATLIFVALHIVYYLLFSSFLTGKVMVLLVYACTVLTFVVIDGYLLMGRKKHDKE